MFNCYRLLVAHHNNAVVTASCSSRIVILSRKFMRCARNASGVGRVRHHPYRPPKQKSLSIRRDLTILSMPQLRKKKMQQAGLDLRQSQPDHVTRAPGRKPILLHAFHRCAGREIRVSVNLRASPSLHSPRFRSCLTFSGSARGSHPRC